jgi:hypothetical protein
LHGVILALFCGPLLCRMQKGNDGR